MRSQRRHATRRDQMLLAVLLLAVFGNACSEPPSPPGPSILLITVDTLRADHVGTYRPQDPLPSLTPRIDELASKGVLFENAAAPMALTRPSHFSMLTSLYPRQHGVLNNQLALPDTVTTVPEILADTGYRTGGFVAVSLLDKSSGAARGFETFLHPTLPREYPAEEVVGRALEWMSNLEADWPFFAWVHLFDPHMPYNPPDDHRAELDRDLAERWPSLDWQQLFEIAGDNAGDIPAPIYDHARALYRGEVQYVDSQVGALLDGLAGLGRLENTLIVFTADHGESFENGIYFEHGDSLFDSAIRIPLIISRPGGAGSWLTPGRRVGEQVSAIDIAPTVLMAAGIESPAGLAGRPLQEADRFGDRYVLIQHPFFRQFEAVDRPQLHNVIQTVGGQPVVDRLAEEERVGLVGVNWKFLRTGEHSTLYSRIDDPHETQDLAAVETEVLQDLQTALARQLEAHPLTMIDSGLINESLRETLEALGYLN